MAGKHSPAKIHFGDFELNPQSGELLKHGIRLRLPGQSFKILAMLLEKPNEVVTREELQKKLWPADTFVDFEHSVNSAVKRLREALNDSAEEPRFIGTLPRLGYRYIGPTVRRTETIALNVVDAFISSEVPAKTTEPADVSRVARHKRRIAILFWPAFGCLALLGMAFAFDLAGIRGRVVHLVQPSAPKTTSVIAAIKLRPSVAVLGFKNLSGRKEEVWLSTALAEMLTTELGAGGQLRIIPEENIARAKSDLSLVDSDSFAAESLTRIRQNLGSDMIVAGSYTALGRKSGGQIRLDLRLQDTHSGETIASVAETGSQSQLFELVSQAGLKLRQKLGVGEISSGDAQGMRATTPANAQAAELYPQAIAKLRVFDALGAKDLLIQTISVEPDFPLAHAALADVWSALGYDAKSRDEAKRAFELSSKLPREERLVTEARYRKASQKWDAAVKIYESLYTFFPDNIEYGLLLADAQSWAGKGKEAIMTLDALGKLPPPLGSDPRIDAGRAAALNLLGDWDNSRASAARASEKSRAAGMRMVLARSRNLEGVDLMYLGQTEASMAACQEAREIYADAGDRNSVGKQLNDCAVIRARQGDLEGARKIWEETLPEFRKTGNAESTAAVLNNLGIVNHQMGRLKEGLRLDLEAQPFYREVSDQDGLARSIYEVGTVLHEQGALEQARSKFEEALQTARELTDDSLAGFALDGLGGIALDAGDLAAAKQHYQEAFKLRTKIAEKQTVAETQVHLAEILLEEGAAEDAEKQVRGAMEEFEKEDDVDDQIFAGTTLASALLQEGKIPNALVEIGGGEKLIAKSVDLDSFFQLGIAAGRVFAASHQEEEAVRRLRAVIEKASQRGYLRYELEARLALGEMEMHSGLASGRARLAGLDKDATAKGFLRIARKAHTASSAKQAAANESDLSDSEHREEQRGISDTPGLMKISYYASTNPALA